MKQCGCQCVISSISLMRYYYHYYMKEMKFSRHDGCCGQLTQEQ